MQYGTCLLYTSIWGADTKSFSNVISLPSLKLAGGSIAVSYTHLDVYKRQEESSGYINRYPE